MNKKRKQNAKAGVATGEAILRVHPFPTLLAQAIQLADFAGVAEPGSMQVFAKSAVVFAAMSLECAATSCLELTTLPSGPFGKIDRTLSVIDKFDLLLWFSTRNSLDRGLQTVQKVDNLVSLRNEIVHSRVKRQPFGPIRSLTVGEGVLANADEELWNELRIPKDEINWTGDHAKQVVVAVVEFLNYFFFEACKMDPKSVVQMLCTSSGDAVLFTKWQSQVLSSARDRLGLKLRFVGF